MKSKMVYVFDHIEYPAQINFSIEGDSGMSMDAWDEEAENMLVSLFNDQSNDWTLNTCMEEDVD